MSKRLEKKYFFAISKLKQCEEKYHTTLAQLERDGLPDDANYEMHEEYIMWRHWDAVSKELSENISIATIG